MYFPSLYALIFLVISFICWLVNELAVELNNQTDSKNINKEARINNKLLVVGTLISMGTLIFFLILNVKFSSFGLIEYPIVSYLGSSIAMVGVFIRRVAINTLRQHFDGIIQIKEGQKLITYGLYKYARHPSYTGSVLTFLGLGLASLNMISMFVLPTFILVAYHYRIKLEEKILTSSFGEEYVTYRNNTSALFPRFIK